MTRRPRYTDARPRYRTASESREPGYLARRMKAYARLNRMRRRHNIIVLRAKGRTICCGEWDSLAGPCADCPTAYAIQRQA